MLYPQHQQTTSSRPAKLPKPSSITSPKPLPGEMRAQNINEPHVESFPLKIRDSPSNKTPARACLPVRRTPSLLVDISITPSQPFPLPLCNTKCKLHLRRVSRARTGTTSDHLQPPKHENHDHENTQGTRPFFQTLRASPMKTLSSSVASATSARTAQPRDDARRAFRVSHCTSSPGCVNQRAESLAIQVLATGPASCSSRQSRFFFFARAKHVGSLSDLHANTRVT